MQLLVKAANLRLQAVRAMLAGFRNPITCPLRPAIWEGGLRAAESALAQCGLQLHVGIFTGIFDASHPVISGSATLGTDYEELSALLREEARRHMLACLVCAMRR